VIALVGWTACLKAKIAHVLKHAGRMDHNTLVREAIERLRGHFQPTSAMIQVLYDWNRVFTA